MCTEMSGYASSTYTSITFLAPNQEVACSNALPDGLWKYSARIANTLASTSFHQPNGGLVITDLRHL